MSSAALGLRPRTARGRDGGDAGIGEATPAVSRCAARRRDAFGRGSSGCGGDAARRRSRLRALLASPSCAASWSAGSCNRVSQNDGLGLDVPVVVSVSGQSVVRPWHGGRVPGTRGWREGARPRGGVEVVSRDFGGEGLILTRACTRRAVGIGVEMMAREERGGEGVCVATISSLATAREPLLSLSRSSSSPLALSLSEPICFLSCQHRG